MKSVAITDANRALADYAREAQHETLVVTRRGKPMAAVVPIRGVDLESLAVATNPDFIALIARARARFKETGGFSLEEMKRRWGGGQALRRPSRRPAARRAMSKTIRPTPRRAPSR
jgi:prevent-host-death family protein